MEEKTVDQWREKLHSITLPALRDAYREVSQGKSDSTRDKLLAELCYLISLEELKLGNFREASSSAQESIRLYEKLGINTLEQAAPILFRHVRDKMHEDVVRQDVIDKIPASFRK